MALDIKSPRDLGQMRAAGALLWHVLEQTVRCVRPGVTTAQIAAQFQHRLAESRAEAVMISSGFPAALSVCVNEEVSHGVPGSRILREGDVVTVDAGLRLDGWCADLARCAVVGEHGPVSGPLVDAARNITERVVAEMRPDRWWSEVAAEAHKAASVLGVRVLAECRGHGIGRNLHEGPAAGFAYLSTPEGGNRTLGGQDFVLRPGLVLTVEPVVTTGRSGVRALDDGWTMVLEDRSAAAFEERTVAVTRQGPVVLTSP